MGSCGIDGNCGSNVKFDAPPQPQLRGGPGETQDTADAQVAKNKTCGPNGCGSGGSTGGGQGAYASPSGGSCGPEGCGGASKSGGGKAAKQASGSCGEGGCGKKAGKAGEGQQGGRKGLFKATIMTVASAELAQLTLDYTQYLS